MTNTNDRADVAAEREQFIAALMNELSIIENTDIAKRVAEQAITNNDMSWRMWQARAAISSAVPDGGKGEAVYQYRLASGDWRDQSEVSYRNNLTNCPDKVRIVYTAPQAECAPRAKPFVMDLHDVVEMWNSTTADSFEGQLIELAAKAINFYKDTLPGSAIEQAVNKGAA